MWVKICGNTNQEDVLAARELGAHAFGFVFAPSKRQVTTEQVASIVHALPPNVETIGVFNTHNAQALLATVQCTGLSGVQLHGSLNIALLEQLRNMLGPADSRIRLIQTIHWSTGTEPAAQTTRISAEIAAIASSGAADAILIDSRTAHASGGTGVQFDWTAAAAALRTAGIRVIVAGGLNPANVGTAIATLQPFGVDVVTGVESAPGRKDAAKMAAFIQAATQPIPQ